MLNRLTKTLLFSLLQVVGGFALMWVGFECRGEAMPTPSEAPWLWGVIGAVLMVPARYWGWDAGSDGWSGDFGGGCDD